MPPPPTKPEEAETPATKPAEAEKVAPKLSLPLSLIEKGKSFLLGDDLFISYARADSTNYAAALADRLSEAGFVCYLDQYETAISNKLPERLQRRLRRSTVFVLIGSPEAVKSKYVREEIELFKTTERPIIPIDVDGAFMDSEYSPVRGLPLSIDAQPAAESGGNLKDAQPSQTVINRIASSYKYTKRTQRQRSLLIDGSAFLLLSVVLGFYYAFEASHKVAVSDMATAAAGVELEYARSQTLQAEYDQFMARVRATQAGDREREAEGNAATAENRAAIEEERAVLAGNRARAAAERERAALETAARAEADAARQKKIASALEEVNLASQLVNDKPDEALAASARAYDAAPFLVEARGGLLNSLLRYPRLKAVARFSRDKIWKMSSTLGGRIIVTIHSQFADVNFYDTEAGRLVAAPPSPHRDRTMNLSCLPNGGLCASTDAERIVLWRVTSGSGGPAVESGPVLERSPKYDDWHNSLALVSEELLVTDDHTDKSLLFWDPRRPEAPPTRRAIQGLTSLGALAVTPDRKTLAVVGRRADGHGIFFWELAKLNEQPDFVPFPGSPSGGHGSVMGLSFSHDGRFLAAGTTNDWVLLIDVRSRKTAPDFVKGAGSKVAFLQGPPHRRLASASEDGKIILWDVLNPQSPLHKPKVVEHYKPGVRALGLLPGDGAIVTANRDGSIAFWDVGDEPPLGRECDACAAQKSHLPKVDYVSFDESGRHLLLAAPGQQFRWDVVTDQLKPFTPGTGGGDVSFPLPPRHKSPESFRVQVLPGKGKWAVSRDGKTLAAINNKRVVVLWDISDGEQAVERGQLDENAASHLVFSDDGKRLAVGYNNGEVVLWDVATRKPLRVFASPLTVDPALSELSVEATVWAIAFSSDGSMLASSNKLSPVTLWDTETGRLIGRLEKKSELEVNALAFSRDGRRLASVSKHGLTVWDTDPSSWAERARGFVPR